MDLVAIAEEKKMLSERRGSSLDDTIKSGILELDMILGGGFPKGTFICVEGDIGTGTSTMCVQAAWTRLTSGGLASYLCLDELPETVIRHFKSFGYDIEHYIDLNRFLLYDGLPFVSSMAASVQGQNGLAERKNLLAKFLGDYKDTVCGVQKKNPRIALPGLTVVDSFSSLAPYVDLKSTYILTHMIANHVRENKNLFLVVVHTGAIEANVVCACNSNADGIIRLEQHLSRSQLKRVMRIEKIAFTPTPTELLEFKITSNDGLQIVHSL